MTVTQNEYRGTFTSPMAPADVRRLVGDPVWVAETDGTGTTVRAEPDGSCVLGHATSPSAFKTVVYTVRHCPTDTGWKGTLVDSNAFDTYGVLWEVEPQEGGSRVSYTLTMTTSLPIPNWVISGTTRRGVEHLLARVEAALTTSPRE